LDLSKIALIKNFIQTRASNATQREEEGTKRVKNRRGNIQVRERRRRFSMAEQTFLAACREERTRADGYS